MNDYQFGDTLPVHKHGYVKLLDVMGNDEAVVDAARISYDRHGQSADRALIRYLLKHKHSSPFEMGVLKFELKMPIFVARQWVRHRTASMNEVSARYTELPPEMFVPDEIGYQSTDNKQGRTGRMEPDDERKCRDAIRDANDDAYESYVWLLGEYDTTRELARGVLPLNVYTKFVWKMDLHNLMHFLNLRLDPHAQKEIRDYAEVIEKLVALHFPLCHEAFVDYVRDAYTCSRAEVKVLRRLLDDYRKTYWPDAALFAEVIAETEGMSKREIADFRRKFFDGE